MSGWWLNQPIWKILVKVDIFPKIGVKILKKSVKPPPRCMLYFTVRETKISHPWDLGKIMDSKVPAGRGYVSCQGGSTFETSSMILVGGSNPHEKYLSNWIIFPGRVENKKCLKPPPRLYFGTFKVDATRSSCHASYHEWANLWKPAMATRLKVNHPARFVSHPKTHITRLISGWDALGKYHLDIV